MITGYIPELCGNIFRRDKKSQGVLKGRDMDSLERIRQEYATASGKKQELAERLKRLEKEEPDNFHQIWILRDQIAYWEGKSEGLKFALDEFSK